MLLLSQRGPPKVEVAKHEIFRTIVVNGILGDHGPRHPKVVVYADELVCDDAISNGRTLRRAGERYV